MKLLIISVLPMIFKFMIESNLTHMFKVYTREKCHLSNLSLCFMILLRILLATLMDNTVEGCCFIKFMLGKSVTSET